MFHLSIDDLHFSYGEQPVLKGLSFGVRRGELVVLVGPNGSGKSTLIRLLTRVLRASKGIMKIGGTLLNTLEPGALARRIAVVPQDTPVEFDFTAFEMILMGRSPYLGLMARESQKDLDMVSSALSLTGTSHLANRSMQQVSGGERQRVIVARALVQQPEVLLLDEPTAHLDINHQVDILRLVRRVTQEQQMATLAVLHDLNQASAFADRIVMLHQGAAAADGPAAMVFTPDRIREVFGARTRILSHPVEEWPVVIPDREEKASPNA